MNNYFRCSSMEKSLKNTDLYESTEKTTHIADNQYLIFDDGRIPVQILKQGMISDTYQRSFIWQ